MQGGVFSDGNALTDKQMVDFCRKHAIQDNLLNLDKFNKSPEEANQYCIIYTGEEPNAYNTPEAFTQKRIKNKTYTVHSQPHTEHWLALYGDKIFDSYGYFDDYKWPGGLNLQPVKLFPSRIQEFDSVVWGEYVLCFLSYIKDLEEKNKLDGGALRNIGRDFCHVMQFGTDRRENDAKVLRWYEDSK